MTTMSPIQLQPGPVTLYAQLAGILRDRIYSGSWKKGDEIPTLQELAEQYGVARVTVRQAVQILSAEGLLSSHRGRRTYVTYDVHETDIRPLYSSVGAVETAETDVPNYSIEVLSVEPFPTVVNRRFNRGTPVAGYVRVRKLDKENNVPYSISETFIAADIFERFPADTLEKVKVVRLVRDHADPKPAHALESISVSSATPEEAAILKMGAGTPVARLSRIFLGPNDEILLYGNYSYRGDRFLIERDISAFLK
jgi:GntR family transcriptional regulator